MSWVWHWPFREHVDLILQFLYYGSTVSYIQALYLEHYFLLISLCELIIPDIFSVREWLIFTVFLLNIFLLGLGKGWSNKFRKHFSTLIMMFCLYSARMKPDNVSIFVYSLSFWNDIHYLVKHFNIQSLQS